MGRRRKAKGWTAKAAARSKDTRPPPAPRSRRSRECAPALLGLAWLGLIAWLDRPEAVRPPERRTWTFALLEAHTVALHGVRIPEAVVRHDGPPGAITLSAQPRLLPASYHGYEPDGHEKAAAQWGFTWALRREGEKLTVRAFGEERTPRHRYLLDEVEVRVPAGVELQLGAPDSPAPLTAPARGR